MNQVNSIGEVESLIIDFRQLAEKRNYFGGEKGKTFIPKALAEHIMEMDKFFFDGSLLYRYEKGVYRVVNDMVIRKRCVDLLERKFKKNYGDEVVHYIKVASYQTKENIDNNPDYINLKNGILEWKAKKLHPHSPDYITTIQLPVVYDPKAKATKIHAFFSTLVPQDTLPMVYEWFGYSMIPITNYEKALMLTGEGSNGKSKFIELYECFIGIENISNVPLQDLDDNRFKLAQLYGKLANTFADIPAKTLEKSSIFKTVVSGDRTSAEFKGTDSFNFKPYARLMFSANEMPRSTDLTNGFFRRWIIIPFLNKFGPGGIKANPNIMQQLTTEDEMSGLLNVALEGLERLQVQGKFTLNDSTNSMIEQYRKDIDNVATFVDEICILAEECEVEKQKLYKSYSHWCFQYGYKAVGLKKFYARIESNFPVRIVRPKNSPRFYVGIQPNWNQ